MDIFDALYERSLGVRIKEYSEGLVADGVSTLSVDHQKGEIFELLEVELEKSDDHTDTTYYGYQLAIDTETFGDTSVRAYHSKVLDMNHKLCAESISVTVDFPALTPATRVTVFIRYKVYNNSMLKQEMKNLGQGDKA